ncbi:glycosyltransferase family 4 protein [Planctomicrobium sp. SH664]|uniref:glycosyltransferase family 4 protein n=1 Tax=Planctomicrobium sp. SH664 TaxID=3448125 RepID=UPI003F5C39FC
MRAWLIHPAEPVPTDGDVRLFRYGLLCRQMAARGIDATQWASTFNHFSKTQRADGPVSRQVEPGYRLELIPGRSYQRHVGFRRIASQRDVAAGFRQRAREVARPDVILVSLPTLELAEAVQDYAAEAKVPVVVDIRDLWPDVFLTAVPAALRKLVAPLLWGYEKQACRICQRAHSLIAVSRDYLDWGLQKAQRQACPMDRVVHSAYQQYSLTQRDRRECQANWEARGITGRRALRCCFFGTLGESAGLEVIAQTARRLLRLTHDDIEFLICGGGPREQELKQLIGDLPNVRYLGWVTSRDLAWIMERCDVGFAAYAPGVLQSLPNKPIEYLAGGLPVLTTLRGELESLLREYDCGEACDPSDIDGLSRWLIRMKEMEGLRSRLRANAVRLFEEQFNATHVYGALIDHLTQIAGQDERRRLSRAA